MRRHFGRGVLRFLSSAFHALLSVAPGNLSPQPYHFVSQLGLLEACH
jgi:hypothetical protein